MKKERPTRADFRHFYPIQPRWSDNDVFARIIVGLAAQNAEYKTVMIDATYLMAHRTAFNIG